MRLLDAAAELLLRWGYQRVTIDDVARQAGVGKGTVYLHFRTKEALFLTVLLRAHRRVVTAVVTGMATDPLDVLPSRMLSLSYLAISDDPVARALELGDAEVLGKLTREATDTLSPLAARRAEISRAYLDALRGCGAVRTDLTVDEQLHLLGAVGLGFFAYESQAGPTDLSPTATAGLLAHTVAAALETPDPDRTALAGVVPGIVADLQSLVALVDEEVRRRVR